MHAVGAARAPAIKLFQDVNMEGRSVRVTDAQSKIINAAPDFNDVVSSCIVESGLWELYTDYRFKGPFVILNAGYYENFNKLGGIGNDKLSSVRPFKVRHPL